jgi:hypothetical protein
MQVTTALLLVAALGATADAKPACRRATKGDTALYGVLPDGRLRACFSGPDQCFALDQGQWTTTPVPPDGGVELITHPLPTGIEYRTVAKSCQGSDCHTFATAYQTVAPAFSLEVYASDDRSTIVAVYPSTLVVLDGATGAERGRIAHSDDTFSIDGVLFIGDRILVWEANGGSGIGKMYDRKTAKKIADFGKVDGSSPLDLGNQTFALVRMGRLDVVDTAGKVVHMTQLAAPMQELSVLSLSRDKKTITLAARGAQPVTVDTTTWVPTDVPRVSCP